MRSRPSYLLWIGVAALLLCAAPGARAQLNEHCTVSVLNRTVPVNPDGSWVLPNVPANFGQVRARATCVENGITRSGQSDFFNINANRMNAIAPIQLGTVTPIPVSLSITPDRVSFTAAGQTRQLAVTATYPDRSVQDVTAASAGTNYTTSNPALVTVSADGLVTAVASGTVVIQATNDGAQGILTVQVVLAEASHGGIPDSWAIAHGLDPNNPTMPFEDPDDDGLTNLQEFQNGTEPLNPDTDRDGLADGQEVLTYHTNPLLADTDGDGIRDGLEVQTGSNPLDPTSFNLAQALTSLEVAPANFIITVNTVIGSANEFIIFAYENSQVTIRNAAGSVVTTQTIPAERFFATTGSPLAAGVVYHVESTGNIALMSNSRNANTAVPSSTGVDVGTTFLFGTRSWGPSAIAIFAYDDVVVTGTNVETGGQAFTRTLSAGQFAYVSGFGDNKFKVVSTGKIALWAGSAEGGDTIDFMGDDLTMNTGDRGRNLLIHPQSQGAFLFVLRDNTSVNIDGTVTILQANQFMDLPARAFHHITADKPVSIETIGGNGLNDWEIALRLVPE